MGFSVGGWRGRDSVSQRWEMRAEAGERVEERNIQKPEGGLGCPTTCWCIMKLLQVLQ